jgi:hypothetical protein
MQILVSAAQTGSKLLDSKTGEQDLNPLPLNQRIGRTKAPVLRTAPIAMRHRNQGILRSP